MVRRIFHPGRSIFPDQVVKGAKILSMTIPSDNDVVFRDSLVFLQMPLSSFPKSFGLTKQQKGFFPHFFNTHTLKKQTYVGPIPARDCHDLEGMSPDRRAEFEKWYAEREAEE